MKTMIPGQRSDSKGDANASRVPGETNATLSPDDRSYAVANNEPEIKRTTTVPKADGGLSRKQKTNLAMISKRAFQKHDEAGLIEDGMKFKEWRHAEVLKATGNRVGGLRHAQNRDFRLIRGHFALLAGETGTAFSDAVNGSPEQADWEQNWEVLKENCEKKNFHFPSYPEAICRQQYKCALRDATTKQLFTLTCTVRNRKAKPDPADREHEEDNIQY